MARKSKPEPGKQDGTSDRLRAHLQSKPAGELVDLLLQFARDHDAVREQLDELVTLECGDLDQLVRQTRKEIRERTNEEIDSRPWGSTGGVLPDYSKLRGRFEALFRAGRYDTLVELGRELFEGAQAQMEGSRDDEGETFRAIKGCLQIAYQALIESPRSPVEKVLWAIDLDNEDGFGLSEGVKHVRKHDWPKEVWSAVADALTGRLSARNAPEEYGREALANDLADALDRAGRGDEVLPLFEAEAPLTGSYARLVRRLIDARRLDDAERWAVEGIGRVDQYEGERLCKLLCQAAHKRRDWPRVAAFTAEKFFESPDVPSFQELMKAAQKASCEPAVRVAALHFLETGQRPGGGEQPALDWPLPAVPRPKPDPRHARWSGRPGPHFPVLIDLAIAEKRPDDVLHWYERLRKERKRPEWETQDDYTSRVADAIAEAHPERALGLYRELIAALIKATHYESAAPFLERVRDLLVARGRQSDWATYLAGLRGNDRRKRRLMAVLDQVQDPKTPR
jgi:uncharacterized Zn finger protein